MNVCESVKQSFRILIFMKVPKSAFHLNFVPLFIAHFGACYLYLLLILEKMSLRLTDFQYCLKCFFLFVVAPLGF